MKGRKVEEEEEEEEEEGGTLSLVRKSMKFGEGLFRYGCVLNCSSNDRNRSKWRSSITATYRFESLRGRG